MKKIVFFILLVTFCSCTKVSSTNELEPQVDKTEIEELRSEIRALQAQVEELSGGVEQAPSVSVVEFEALKEENENLQEKINLLMSGFFEVDGLYFDRNGTLISVEKLESVVTEQKNSAVTLTTTRSYDSSGRLIEIYKYYDGYNNLANSIPYYWQKEIFEYSGMTCKKTTRTREKYMQAGVEYVEEVKITTYW